MSLQIVIIFGCCCFGAADKYLLMFQGIHALKDCIACLFPSDASFIICKKKVEVQRC